jgi:myo-inositol-1(or 4)-monophosphatase
MNYSEFIITNLNQAAEIARENFGKVTGSTKPEDNNQVLTETDLTIGKFLVEAVRKNFPDHNIIDEEAGVIDSKSEFTWVIDPIDGTSNFAKGLPHYGIMIGLLKDSMPIAGGIALPYFQEIYSAEKNNGSFCNSKPIRVTTNTNLLSSLVAYGIDGHQENPEITKKECQILAEIILHIRNLRTSNSAFDMVMTAVGKYDAYLNRTSKIWDNVAIQIILEEAGALYTDFFGKPID